MERTFINLAKDRSRGIEALKGTGVPAVFSDAVRVRLKECDLLFVSGKLGADESGKLVDGETLRDIHDVRSRYFHEGKYPASTLVRVDQLVRDGALIEIDADAVLPPR